jgi:hypothetical protein
VFFQWLAVGRWFSPDSSTNKTDSHNITEIVLKAALNTITLTQLPMYSVSLTTNGESSNHDLGEVYSINIVWYSLIFIDPMKVYRQRTKSVWFMVYNATFNNISALSWRPVLVVEETWSVSTQWKYIDRGRSRFGLWCLTNFPQYFSYIVAVSFIGDGNWSTRRVGRWFSPDSSTNKTNSHNITEIVLKAALNTITLTQLPMYSVSLTTNGESSNHDLGGCFQYYFSYIVAVSFIGWGIRRKPPTYRKSLKKHIKIGWKFKSLYNYQICKISESGPLLDSRFVMK